MKENQSTNFGARFEYLTAIAQHQPVALRSLLHDVFPVYQTFLEAHPNSTVLQGLAQLSEGLRKEPTPELRRVDKAVHRWARKQKFRDDWVLDAAIQTMSNWANKNVATGKWGYFPDELTTPNFATRFGAWIPLDQRMEYTWTEFKKATDALYRRQLADYHAAVCRMWGKGRPRLGIHAIWTVQWQQGKSPEGIRRRYLRSADQKPVSLANIQQAVHEFAASAGLTLRPPKGGRGAKKAGMARTEALAEQLGKSVAKDEAVFAKLLPEVVATDGRLWSFGQGLLEGAANPVELWHRLVAALAATEEAAREPQILQGFLHQLRATNPLVATTLLNEAVEHETLAVLYPFLQVAVALDAADVARLQRSIAFGKAPAAMYGYLASGRATDPISPPDLQELILGIASLPDGQDAGILILQRRLHSDKEAKREPAPELLATGCELLQRIVFTRRNIREDHWLGDISAVCLVGKEGAAVVTGICQRLKSAVAKYETNASNHDDLLVGVFTAQPIAALDGLCGGDQQALELGIRVLREVGSRRHPLAVVSDNDLARWCDVEPGARYRAMAGAITISMPAGQNTPPRWTSLALRFLEKAPDPSAILRIFTSHFSPSSGWSGSLSTILESNAALLDQLEAYPALQDTVTEQKTEVRKWIEQERSRENMWGRERDQRFE